MQIMQNVVSTASGGHDNMRLLFDKHKANVDGKNSLQVDWSDVSLPFHRWTNALLVKTDWVNWVSKSANEFS